MAARLRTLWLRRGPRLAEEDRRLLRRWIGALVAIGLLALFASRCERQPAQPHGHAPVFASRARIFSALRMVESSGRDDVPDGDNGAAIGPYQIHREYWQDAVQAQPGLGGDYQDCRHRDYAERVIGAYMQKWIPDAWAKGDAETIARVHNGGPDGWRRDSTLGYWQKVKTCLQH
jgi:Destabilase